MIRHGRVFVDGGFRPAIVKFGPVWSQVVYIDGVNIRVRKVKGRVKIDPISHMTLRQMAYRFQRPKNVLGVKQRISRGAKAIIHEAKRA